MNKVALTSGAFIAELPDVDLRSTGQRDNPLILRDGFRVIRLKGAPDRKQDAAFCGTVDLHAEVTFAEAVGHEVGADGILACGNGQFGVGVFHGGIARHGIAEVYRGSATTPVEHISLVIAYVVQLQIGVSGAYQQVFEIAEGVPRPRGTLQIQPDVAGLSDLQFTDRYGSGSGYWHGHVEAGVTTANKDLRCCFGAGIEAERQLRGAADMEVHGPDVLGIAPFQSGVATQAFAADFRCGAKAVAGERDLPVLAAGGCGDADDDEQGSEESRESGAVHA